MTSEEDKNVLAANEADWGQVVRNGGPPCFHLEESGKFCLRAERWQGHSDNETEFPYHKFTSLSALIESQAQTIGELQKDKEFLLNACKAAQYYFKRRSLGQPAQSLIATLNSAITKGEKR